MHDVGDDIYIHIRGAFSVARFDRQGNARAQIRGTSGRTGFTFFYSEMYASPGLPVKPCVRYASQKPGDKPLEEYVGAEPLVSVFSFGLIRASS